MRLRRFSFFVIFFILIGCVPYHSVYHQPQPVYYGRPLVIQNNYRIGKPSIFDINPYGPSIGDKFRFY